MALFQTSENAIVSVGQPITKLRVHSAGGRKRYDIRRFMSESNLLNQINWHLKSGDNIFIISGGDCDSLTFLRYIIRQQHLRFCIVSSWCFGVEDVSEMAEWLKRGLVDRFDFYCGEIAKASYAACADELSDIARAGGGRLGVFRNHSKVMVFYGDRFDGVILSSANVNTNPRTENTQICCETDIADFYKQFFDDIHHFNHKDFKDFKPWKNQKS